MNNALLNPQDPPSCSQNSGPHFAEEENVVRGGGGVVICLRPLSWEVTELGLKSVLCLVLSEVL